MNTSRKTIKEAQTDQIGLADAKQILTLPFGASSAVNVHGVHIDIGIIPAADDEVARGNWWVVMFPDSIAGNASLKNDWVDQLNSGTSANTALSSAEFIWGSGTFVTSSNGGGFNYTFAPKTSRNMSKDSELVVVARMNSITGLLDEWETNCSASVFITT